MSERDAIRQANAELAEKLRSLRTKERNPAQVARKAAYNASEKAKVSRRKYNATPKCKEAKRRYRLSLIGGLRGMRDVVRHKLRATPESDRLRATLARLELEIARLGS